MRNNNLIQFTNRFSISKTVRNSLIPINYNGKRMNENEINSSLATLLENDKKINEAYNALKLIQDSLHENLITTSLESSEAKKIDFSSYSEKYKSKSLKENDSIASSIRKEICKTYQIGAKPIIEKAGVDKKGKPIFKKFDYQCLMESTILKYIEKHIDSLVPKETKNEFLKIEIQKNEKGKEVEVRCGHLEVMGRFFTFFDNYNNNRENYYKSDGKSTAVATRIVDINLPKFCDNIIQFENRKDEYLGIYQNLKDKNIETKIKDDLKNQFVEADNINENFFLIAKYNNCLSQPEIEEYNRVIGHYNEIINLYNQSKKGEYGFKKIGHFKTLYKQIGCGEMKSFITQIQFDTHNEQLIAEKDIDKILNLEDTLKEYAKMGNKYFTPSNIEITLYTFINKLKETNNWEGIYWNKSAIDYISNKYFANWHTLKDKITEGLIGRDKEVKNEYKTIASFDKKREEQLKINDAVELSSLFHFLDAEDREKEWGLSFFKDSVIENYKVDEQLTQSQNIINFIIEDLVNSAKGFIEKIDLVLNLTNFKSDENILLIKTWLDTVKPIFSILKNFIVNENKVKGNMVDAEFINIINAILYPYEGFEWNKEYDLIRNYLTRKPQDEAKKNKLKLNFDSSSFLKGMAADYNSNGALIIKHNKRDYLVIVKTKLSKEEIKFLKLKPQANLAYRIVYDYQKPDNKNVPRLFIRSKGVNYSPSVKKYDLPIEDIINIYDKKLFVTANREKNYKEFKVSLTKLIDYFKLGFSKHESYKHYSFNWKESSEYNDIQEFYNDTANSTYQLSKEDINFDNLLELVKQNRLYLFEIYNKDFSETKGEKSKGSKLNLHTMYWNHIFDENSTIKLNGGGEIFYREKGKFDKVVVHKANEPIYRRTDEMVESKFNHDITKNKRFLSNQFFLHIPITLNYSANDSLNNNFLNSEFAKSDKVQFLGIDRGEKHLIYYSLLDSEGKIIKQNHFDIIGNKNYSDTIKEAADKRRKRQENWQQKGNISNLKDGYLSLVVNEIIKLMKNEQGNYIPTYIVLEDLNPGFKRSRIKFEEQTYQNFETAIAKKLNFIVDKNVKFGELGSVNNAIQLTPEVKLYSDIERSKQWGNMLYVRANYTSITDPATGWRKTIYLRKGSEKDIKEQITKSFSEIGIDKNGDYFFNYIDSNNKKWSLWSGKNGDSLERYRSKRGKDKNEYIIETFSVKGMLDKLFENYDKNKSLLSQINSGLELTKINEHTAWETLRFVIDIIQQIRNSGDTSKGQDDNFLLSPVRNEKGEHFDSRKANDNLPVDADANGAYNIAKKGILMIEHYKQWMKNGAEKGKLDLFISDREWDIWNTNRKEWEKWLSEFFKQNDK